MFYFRLLRLVWTIVGKIINHKKESDEIKQSLNAEELRKNPYKDRNLPLENVIGAFKRGFYEAALGATEKLMEDGNPTAEYCFYRGETLLHMGKLKDAERMLRQCLEMQPDQSLTTQAQRSLGNLMLALGRCDEALENFQLILQRAPKNAIVHRAMAEANLVKGELAEALRLARLAVDMQHADRTLTHDLHSRFLGEELATLAWALAANEGSAEKTEELVNEAVATVGLDFVCSTAQVHTQAGAAYAALGQTEKSAYHLGKAASIDMNGLWGRRAKAMMVAK